MHAKVCESMMQLQLWNAAYGCICKAACYHSLTMAALLCPDFTVGKSSPDDLAIVTKLPINQHPRLT